MNTVKYHHPTLLSSLRKDRSSLSAKRNEESEESHLSCQTFQTQNDYDDVPGMKDCNSVASMSSEFSICTRSTSSSTNFKPVKELKMSSSRKNSEWGNKNEHEHLSTLEIHRSKDGVNVFNNVGMVNAYNTCDGMADFSSRFKLANLQRCEGDVNQDGLSVFCGNYNFIEDEEEGKMFCIADEDLVSVPSITSTKDRSTVVYSPPSPPLSTKRRVSRKPRGSPFQFNGNPEDQIGDVAIDDNLKRLEKSFSSPIKDCMTDLDYLIEELKHDIIENVSWQEEENSDCITNLSSLIEEAESDKEENVTWQEEESSQAAERRMQTMKLNDFNVSLRDANASIQESLSMMENIDADPGVKNDMLSAFCVFCFLYSICHAVI